jgi:hypothetical protein
MRVVLLLALALHFIVAETAGAQLPLAFGDVVVSTFTQTGPQSADTKILLYSREGIFKGEVASSQLFRETLVRDGAVYVATISGIQKIGLSGQIEPFSNIRNPVWLAPLRDGSILAANGSGELYHVNADGSLRLYHDTATTFEPPAHGVEVAADQCSVRYLGGGALVGWDLCRNSRPQIVGPSNTTDAGLRWLSDGTFLAAALSDVFHLGADGQTLRRYGVPSQGVALDIDRRSFWAGAGRTLLRIDIETGAILTRAEAPHGIEYISVVGEPRASLTAPTDIPAASESLLLLLACALAVVAALRLS